LNGRISAGRLVIEAGRASPREGAWPARAGGTRLRRLVEANAVPPGRTRRLQEAHAGQAAPDSPPAKGCGPHGDRRPATGAERPCRRSGVRSRPALDDACGRWDRLQVDPRAVLPHLAGMSSPVLFDRTRTAAAGTAPPASTTQPLSEATRRVGLRGSTGERHPRRFLPPGGGARLGRLRRRSRGQPCAGQARLSRRRTFTRHAAAGAGSAWAGRSGYRSRGPSLDLVVPCCRCTGPRLPAR
jgi:hypothetical protein